MSDNIYLIKGFVLIMRQALNNLAGNDAYHVREISEATYADIVIFDCMPGELSLPFSRICQKKNVTVSKDSGFQIRIVSEKIYLPWINCTTNAAVLYRYANLEETKLGLKSFLKIFLRPCESTKSDLVSKCTYCFKEKLSKREFETLLRIGLGQNVSLMAQLMGCSPKTISGYKRRCMTKLNLLRPNEFNGYARHIANEFDSMKYAGNHKINGF